MWISGYFCECYVYNRQYLLTFFIKTWGINGKKQKVTKNLPDLQY